MSIKHSTTPATAIVVDDEQLLLDSLCRQLGDLWPELTIAATASNGKQAMASLLEHAPDLVFLDIKMPGQSGLDVAEAIAEDWPDDIKMPLVVFVTAYDEFAVEAFSSAAFDYLLKPVTTTRLEKTIFRLKQQLGRPVNEIEAFSRQLQSLQSAMTNLGATAPSAKSLKTIRAGSGDTVTMIQVDDVILFEAADKYITVYTEEGEALIREPLRSLIQQLDTSVFAQIHRSAIVNLHRVQAAKKDDSGKMTLLLRGLEKQPTVSRIYRHLFQAM